MARAVTSIAVLAVLLLASGTTVVHAQPGGGTTCALDGTSANIGFSTSGTNRVIKTNGCPNHAIRTINPNAATTITNFGVTSQQYQVPLAPYLAPTAQIINTTCLGGAIGWSRSGGVISSVFAGGACGGDAVKLEGHTFDECGGHSDQSGMYHYHLTPSCTLSNYTTSTTSHGPIMGYMVDGIPIYGPRGDGGNLPTDLDSCGGHSSDSGNNGQYHYHFKPIKGTLPDSTTPLSTADLAAAGGGWPYTPGCLRGCVPDTLLNFLRGRGVTEQTSFASCSAAGTVQNAAESIPENNGPSVTSPSTSSTPSPSTGSSPSSAERFVGLFSVVAGLIALAVM